jgi:hypothetical protein
MEVGAHSDAHFQFVSQDAFLSPGTFYVVKGINERQRQRVYAIAATSNEGARITSAEAAENPTHAQ